MCSENKGAEQLRGYSPRSWSAPLFSHMQIVGFLIRRLLCIYVVCYMQFEVVILRICTVYIHVYQGVLKIQLACG